LREGLRLLVEGNQIKAVATGNPAAPDDAQVIDCGGRVIMPGLIDAHWHALFAALPAFRLMTEDVGFIHLAAGAEAERTLMRASPRCGILAAPCSLSSRRSTKAS
jgi:imidazolonepropionase-like amidohydrolase